MSFYTISYATSTTKIELKITDPNDSAKSQVISNPKYITGLTHNIVSDGIANKLTLTLVHFIDPFREETDYPKDIFGEMANSPSYLMVLINNGLQKVQMRYGYAQGTQSADKAMTDWFDMIISGVSLKYSTNYVTYIISAVSSIVSDNLQTYIYNWRLMEDTDENSSTAAVYDSTRMKTIVDKAIEASSTESDISVLGLNCRVKYNNDIIPILPSKYFTDTSNATLIQSNIDNVNFVKGCLSKCVALAGSKYVSTTDDYGNVTTTHCTGLHTNFTINFSDTDNGTKAVITPTMKIYVSNFDSTTFSFDRILQYESENEYVDNSLGYLVYYGPQAVKSRTDFRSRIKDNDLYVSAEVISMDLEFPVIVGLYKKLEVTSIDAEGSTVDQEQVSVELSISNGDATLQSEMSQLTTTAQYNKVAGSLIATGSITIPGVSRILTMLSMFQLYVYVSNVLDVVSGNYRILSQTDNISNGIYTTVLDVYKESSLSGESVYGA